MKKISTSKLILWLSGLGIISLVCLANQAPAKLVESSTAFHWKYSADVNLPAPGCSTQINAMAVVIGQRGILVRESASYQAVLFKTSKGGVLATCGGPESIMVITDLPHYTDEYGQYD